MAERGVTSTLMMVLLVFSAICISLASSANGMTPPYQPIDEMNCVEDNNMHKNKKRGKNQ